jgi:hypothetical protein
VSLDHPPSPRDFLSQVFVSPHRRLPL